MTKSYQIEVLKLLLQEAAEAATRHGDHRAQHQQTNRSTRMIRKYWLEIVAVALAVSLVSFTAVIASVQTTCLRAGFPESSLDWSLHGYCIKRIDQTDVVVPSAQVSK